MAKRKPNRKRKVSKTQPKRKKINFINNKLRQFSEFFGKESSEYKEIEKIIITQVGIAPNTIAFKEIFPSRSPLQLTDSFEGMVEDEFLNELHKRFKEVVIYKKIGELYGSDILNMYNSGKSTSNKVKDFDYNFFRKNMKMIRNYVSAKSILSTLTDAISDLPNYYSALDNMDATTQTILRSKFQKYGLSYDVRTGKRDEDLARELMENISKYYEERLNLGTMIKNSERIVHEDNIFEQNVQHKPVRFKIIDDDDSPNWGSARKKIKK